MKVAIVHDYLKEYGGAERVLETLHEMYPDADVFTSIYCPKYLGPHRERFKKWNIKTSFLQYIPFKEKLISPFRLISSRVFKSFDFSKYDLIIVSATGAYFPNSVKKGSAKLICYCHTPPRYLYGYKTARDWESKIVSKIIGSVVNHFLRMVDFNSAQNVDLFIANSEEVKSRIEKFYRRKAIVIYPPVNIPARFKIHDSRFRNYYLAGGRLARAKRVDLAVEACTKLNLPLKVFGKSFAGYGEELAQITNLKSQISKVEFLGEVTEEEKLKLMAGAKAYIFPAESEDFGITPVEAMATGTPVIAYKSGGVMETVIDGKTGVFFDETTLESLISAIKRFEKTNIRPEDCVKQAKKFSKEKFVKDITEIVERVKG
ncbi:MAG TPA: glycosyltransferase [Patescibacteria group bacterium]|nr:glycosyltransferase [Patescibacteria group bacterium]